MMIVATPTSPRRTRLRKLLIGGGAAAIAAGLAATPASAQLAQMRAHAGTPTGVTAPTVAIPLRPVNMQEALQRAQALQSRTDQIRGYVTSARDAALAATREQPTDGISDDGLDPIAAVREAARLRALGGDANDAAAAQLLVSVSATNDATGTNTWEGAAAPVQTGSGGKTTVTIDQTQQHALLSWNRFDIGANTTLQFNQQQGGVAQPGWTAVNRVVGTDVAPSTILGAISADGTVLVLNRNGVIFGASAQVNLHSLLVSTLEIGNYGSNFRNVIEDDGTVVNVFDATTIKQRNDQYLQNGLFASIASSGALPALLLSPLYAPGVNRTGSTPDLEGDVTIDAGATITAGTGGFLIFAGPSVSNAGTLSASDGQVSLQGGRLIAASQSTGAATSADANVRGLILRTVGTVTEGTQRRSNAAIALDPTPDDGKVINTGLIESPRGYLSLGAGLFGSVTNDGLLTSTTSVSRNGKISLTAGTVTLGGSDDPSHASGIVILPDASAETIPQGTANDPPTFKTSQVEIGARADDTSAPTSALGLFIPAVVSIGQNAVIWAPSGNVVVGRDNQTAFNPAAPIGTASGITIGAGAVIDVSGVKDVQLSADRNSLEITPVKRNELRDTPNYREVTLDGSFTLNGTTLYVDPRRVGVRDDGVVWVGSPLIEAGSLASQIGVTASELMTKGGNVSLGVNLISAATDVSVTSRISIARDAVIDFSGGWVHYAAGIVRSSNLITADGRIVNIGDADPNDVYVGVSDGFTAYEPRFGLSQTFGTTLTDGSHYEQAYDEGRDAGSLVIGGSSITIDGTFYGNAFAGARQVAGAQRPSLAPAIARDPRMLQASAGELPAGGFLRIGSFTGAAGVAAGGDYIVYHGARGAVDADGTQTLLSDATLSDAGLSALTLQTSGAVTFAGAGYLPAQPDGVLSITGASDLTLANGGTLTVDAGRAIAFDGDVTIASGRIAARTYELSRAPIADGSLTAIGSAFRSDDDIAGLYAVGSALPHPFDITVTGTLSTAGRWVNDYATTTLAQGGAWTDGGSISLAVAPKVLVALGDSVAAASDAGDLSGSIVIDPGALLNVSAGGYVAPDRSLKLTARGGDISLINETTYTSTELTVPTGNETAGRGNQPIAGSNQSVTFTPSATIVPALVPSDPQARVSFDEASLKGLGFSGGGTFTLVAPSISFGSDDVAGSAHLSLDFFRKTGFGTLNATAFHSRMVSDLFSNGRTGDSAFFDTTTFTIHDGETLDLTQALLPAFLTTDQARALLMLGSGSDITQTLSADVPAAAFDQRAANLALGGISELDVAAGGRIVGAAGATITTPKLLNAGSILIHGGAIVQREFLPINIASRGLGVHDEATGGMGLADVFGAADENGQYDETALNVAGVTDAQHHVVSNHDLVSRPASERFIYFLGALGADDGIRLAADSSTDLSGTALIDPRAGFVLAGTGGVGTSQLVTGRVIDGGSITTAAMFNPATNDASRTLFTNPVYGNSRYLNAADNSLPPIVGVTGARTIATEAGARIDISGASATFDELATPTSYAKVREWSDAGTISVGGAGSLAGATIDAHGGDPRATGGTLQWVRPILVQTDSVPDPTAGTDPITGEPIQPPDPSGTISADEIMASGFSTFNAFGGITFNGAVSLTLGKAFTLQSAPTTTGVPVNPDAAITVSASAGSIAAINAPFIRFASRLGSVPSASNGVGDATVSFNASSGIDFVGATLFDNSIGATYLTTPGDIRFIGVDDRLANSTALASLNGQVIAAGNIDFDAGRVYATTGTGNLQRFIEDTRVGNATTVSPFLVAALGLSTITFGGTYADGATTAPLSAGSYLRIVASGIEQDGYLAAPLGLLEIGNNAAFSIGATGASVRPTDTLTFGAGGVTTVSGAGLDIPYGTTTDLSEYFFAPSVGLPITATPIAELRLSGGTIDVAAGARVDGRGGGDIFAYEFVSGTGGSRDVLSRFNMDQFSSNDYDANTGIGYQYPDHRQVYAIVPAAEAQKLAAYDPIYSADYTAGGGSDLYGADAGRSITLDGAGGIPAGQYVLMPAHYALLPGAYRVVENVGGAAPPPGTSQTLLDGSVIVGGNYSTAGTGFEESLRRSFTIQSRDTFLKYSRIETTSGSTSIANQAIAAGKVPPRLPIDAARVILSAQTALSVAGVFDTAAATGGRGAQFDITGSNIVIGSDTDVAADGSLLLSDTTLENLDANSLAIGARRTDNADGTTTLGVVAKSIEVLGDASLTAPELILAVAGSGSTLTVDDGASVIARGTLDDTLTGAYVIASAAQKNPGDPSDVSGIGAILRLSSGSERLIDRQGNVAAANSAKPALLTIGAATLKGASLALDSSRDFTISDGANLNARAIAISSDVLAFDPSSIGAALVGKLSAAGRLTLRSSGVIGFDAGTYQFHDLRIDAPGIGTVATAPGSVTLDTADFTIGNDAGDPGACGDGGIACGTGGATLTVNATGISFGSGTVRTYGFDGGVTLGASGGAYVDGTGRLDTGAASLTLLTPFLADRAQVADPRRQTVRPDYTFATAGDFTMRAPVLAASMVAPMPAGDGAPGARIAIGSNAAPVASVTIDGSLIRATAGIIDIESTGTMTLSGAADLATPGYTRQFGDTVDPVTISAGGGTINLVSLTGDLALGAATTLTVDSGVGSAGTLRLLAGNGAITLGSTIDPGVSGARDASLVFDAGRSAFDLAGFVTAHGAGFGGDIAIRSGAGDLALDAGQVWRARNIDLVADGGAVSIAGTLDTSGVLVAGLSANAARTARVNGGDITLYGRTGVALAATALLDTHTDGYADADTRQASAGDVTIGIGDDAAAITFASGATIDAGAHRTEAAIAAGKSGNRLIAQTVKDPVSLADTTVYRLAMADTGGTVSFRAPVIGVDGNKVDIRMGGMIVGAGSIEVEGVREYDLNAIASSGLYSGVHDEGNGAVSLNLADTLASTGLNNILADDFVGADGTRSVVDFVRTFAVTTVDGSSLGDARLRAGVELDATGGIDLATNWNLGAGTLDQQGALAAGLLQVIPQLGVHADGTPYYAVVAGADAALLRNYVTMSYRTGGLATGEAAVLTLRAGGTLGVAHSISDGFFSFGDRTDPRYMSYQLSRADGTTGILAPYSVAANSAAAIGSGAGGAGDPLGGADLFPLLDAGQTAVRSTSYRLVGGAGASSDPLYVNRATGGNVAVTGEQSYAITVPPGSPVNFGTGNIAYVETIVRTGDGDITIAAAHDIDLRRTADIVYRNSLNTTAGNISPSLRLDPQLYQVGGSAVYTAGHLAIARSFLADPLGGGAAVRFDWNPAAAAPAFDDLAYQPSIRGNYFNAPALLEDGGDLSLTAATGDLLARRDVWAEQNLGQGAPYVVKGELRTTYLPAGYVGAENQRWRVGAIGEDSEIAVVPQLFTAGVGALGGGDVAIAAGGIVSDLNLVLDTGITTVAPFGSDGGGANNPLLATSLGGDAARPTLVTFGGGNASIASGGDLVGGQFDFASGSAGITVGGDVVTAGYTAKPQGSATNPVPQGDVNELRVRIADATVALTANGVVDLGGAGALGVTTSVDPLMQDAAQGFFSADAGLAVQANGIVTLTATRPELRVTDFSDLSPTSIGYVLPPSLALTSLTDDIALASAAPRLLYPSPVGQLALFAGRDLDSLSLVMSDADPSLLPGAFSVRSTAGGSSGGLDFGFDGVFPKTPDAVLRRYHNSNVTHAGDSDPVRIYAGGSITNSIITLPKLARIGAGLDIVDLFFVGQNVAADDVTRITAGRDILGTTAFSTSARLPYLRGANFILGGLGTLSIEAGRNLGPFTNSATVVSAENAGSYGGGIRTVGNDLNPWLGDAGASVDAFFGIARGADYDALQSVYLDPGNAANLDGDLFVQVSDASGNLHPDRTRPVYAPILARWLRDHAPDAFAAVFGTDMPTDADLSTQYYAKFGDLFAAFSRLDNLSRRAFLVDQLYFHELAETNDPSGPSYLQYVRGYRATQTLFPTSLGYTDNLATYTTDPASISADHPLGMPVKNVVDGQPQVAMRIATGNVDLRLATIETARGGDVTILGPGGNVIAGSVVRTSDQAARRATLFGAPASAAFQNGIIDRTRTSAIASIPIGFEGVLTLRGGAIRSSTDGDFRLNQSRLFTLAGGDITLWSSNGDLNAGQGPKSASNFPPITVRFDQNGRSEVDSAGSVSGAGIGAFKQAPGDPDSDIVLVAPVGEVDAGDAGVRASGNVFVAAARVANADNFTAGGMIAGVPSAGLAAAPAIPANAASSVVGQLAGLANANADNADRLSLISVDVLGFVSGNNRCDDPNSTDRKNCPTKN